MKKIVTAALAAVSMAACTGGSQSSSGAPRANCDARCQSNLAAADGKTLPPGRAFNVDSGSCGQWNRLPSSVTFYVAGVYAERLGAHHPSFMLQRSFEKAITISCRSYVERQVAHVSQVLANADPNWPHA